MSVVTKDFVKQMNGWTDDTYDARINALIPIVENRLSSICNNAFLSVPSVVSSTTTIGSRGSTGLVFTSSARTITDTDAEFSTSTKLAAGDDIYIQDSYKNDGHYELLTVTDTVLTVTTLYTITDENFGNSILLSLVKWPSGIDLIAVDMIKYDIIGRYKSNGVKSERIGDYAVTFDNESRDMGAYGYPLTVIGGLSSWTKPTCI
jgi:hypothetical protein